MLLKIKKNNKKLRILLIFNLLLFNIFSLNIFDLEIKNDEENKIIFLEEIIYNHLIFPKIIDEKFLIENLNYSYVKNLFESYLNLLSPCLEIKKERLDQLNKNFNENYKNILKKIKLLKDSKLEKSLNSSLFKYCIFDKTKNYLINKSFPPENNYSYDKFFENLLLEKKLLEILLKDENLLILLKNFLEEIKIKKNEFPAFNLLNSNKFTPSNYLPDVFSERSFLKFFKKNNITPKIIFKNFTKKDIVFKKILSSIFYPIFMKVSKSNKFEEYFYNIGDEKIKFNNQENLLLFASLNGVLSKILIFIISAMTALYNEKNLDCYSNLENENSLLLELKKLLKVKNNLLISNFSYLNNFIDNFEKISKKIFINFEKSNGFFLLFKKKRIDELNKEINLIKDIFETQNLPIYLIDSIAAKAFLLKNENEKYSIPQYINPEPEQVIFEAEEIFSPEYENPKSNSISLSNEKNRNMLITGPSGAGKTDFLRTIIKTSLFSNIGIVPGKLRITPFNFIEENISSINIFYNLSKGQIERKDTIEFFKNLNNTNKPVLICIDEIFSAVDTPTSLYLIETIIKNNLESKNLICIINTHQREHRKALLNEKNSIKEYYPLVKIEMDENKNYKFENKYKIIESLKDNENFWLSEDKEGKKIKKAYIDTVIKNEDKNL